MDASINAESQRHATRAEARRLASVTVLDHIGETEPLHMARARAVLDVDSMVDGHPMVRDAAFRVAESAKHLALLQKNESLGRSDVVQAESRHPIRTRLEAMGLVTSSQDVRDVRMMSLARSFNVRDALLDKEEASRLLAQVTAEVRPYIQHERNIALDEISRGRARAGADLLAHAGDATRQELERAIENLQTEPSAETIVSRDTNVQAAEHKLADLEETRDLFQAASDAAQAEYQNWAESHPFRARNQGIFPVLPPPIAIRAAQTQISAQHRKALDLDAYIMSARSSLEQVRSDVTAAVSQDKSRSNRLVENLQGFLAQAEAGGEPMRQKVHDRVVEARSAQQQQDGDTPAATSMRALIQARLTELAAETGQEPPPSGSQAQRVNGFVTGQGASPHTMVPMPAETRARLADAQAEKLTSKLRLAADVRRAGGLTNAPPALARMLDQTPGLWDDTITRDLASSPEMRKYVSTQLGAYTKELRAHAETLFDAAPPAQTNAQATKPAAQRLQ